jgi:hypothetical protein
MGHQECDNAGMFVGDEVVLDVGFAAARERLLQLAAGGVLTGPSQDAYDRGTSGLARVGVAGLSKLVRVQVRELAWTDRSAGLAIRWEATGPAGGLFPVLDADIRLTPDGARATVLTMAGTYRSPLGPVGKALDRALLHRVASATIREFIAQVAARITDRPSAAEATASNGTGVSPPPDASRPP